MRRIVFLILLIIFLSASFQRNLLWKDEIGLWEDVVKKAAEKERGHTGLFEAHYNLGLAYYNHGRIDEAIREYLTAIELNPDDMETHNNLGNAYANKGLFDMAIKEYLAALKISPNYAPAYNNMGNVYHIKGWLDEAIVEYLKALRIAPSYIDAHYNLGIIYMAKGLKDKARKEFEMALKLKPDFTEAQEAIIHSVISRTVYRASEQSRPRRDKGEE